MYAAVTKDEGNKADGRFSAACQEREMPRVKMTRMTRIALYGLRIYLIFLFILIIVRFLRVF